MPVFEFQCAACGRTFSDLVREQDGTLATPCPNCGSQDIHKLPSKFMRLRSEDERLTHAVDSMAGVDDNNYGAVMHHVQEAGRALDDDLSGDLSAMMDADFSGGDFGGGD
ncbi:MAG: zinc ribbon domain-containing protein [Chthonomonas sp.]|nr:zinc ribbon domain-containing protein [Chthonomonas sp.]